MARFGLRTLVYAYKDMDSDHWENLQAQNNNFANESDRYVIESDLIFVAAFGLNDELRDGVKQSIEKLNEGGITTRMLSGDHIQTAIAAALKSGILHESEIKRDNTVMLGEEFFSRIGGIKKIKRNGVEEWVPDNMSEFKKIASKCLVLARCTPAHKLAFVRGLREKNFQIAMTADGINDAQALSSSSVGFCMGISGCEVAKDASDIIILDDNFNSVFRAV